VGVRGDEESPPTWPEEDIGLFWDTRKTYLPAHLRLEDNPHDVGVKPEKQNHYRLTGGASLWTATGLASATITAKTNPPRPPPRSIEFQPLAQPLASINRSGCLPRQFRPLLLVRRNCL
jgi:hypothetical protein